MVMTRRIALLFAVFFLSGISSFDALFAPSKKLWDIWLPYNDNSSSKIDHSVWEAFLQRYVSRDAEGVNRVAYNKVSDADKALLDGYIATLSSVPIRRYSKNEQLAFWVNLYNALTVDVVIEHLPIDTIRDIDISPGLFGDGPWDKKLIDVEGEAISLNDIEHRILRPIWGDPRLHYVLNCASVGCPNLPAHAIQAGDADAMLDQAARDYVNAARATWTTPEGLGVSSLYVWYAEDFGKNDQGIIEHLLPYAEGPTRTRLEGAEEIVEHDYDWRLNQAK